MVVALGFIHDGPQDQLNSVSPSRATISFPLMLLLEQLTSVTLPKLKRLKLLPYLLMTPMLAEYVSWVYLTRDVVELHHTTCDSLTSTLI